jgi:hypothetical protein
MIERYDLQTVRIYRDVEYDVNGNPVETTPYTVKGRVVLKQQSVRGSNGTDEIIDGHIKTRPEVRLERGQRIEYQGVAYKIAHVYEILGLRGNIEHWKYHIKRQV